MQQGGILRCTGKGCAPILIEPNSTKPTGCHIIQKGKVIFLSRKAKGSFKVKTFPDVKPMSDEVTRITGEKFQKQKTICPDAVTDLQVNHLPIDTLESLSIDMKIFTLMVPAKPFAQTLMVLTGKL